MEQTLPPRTRQLRDVAERVARESVAPNARQVDREARWPREDMGALAQAGLMGLHVPRTLGGEAQGLVGLVAVTEAIAKASPSTAMCYGMHCVGTAVIAAKATEDHEERYLAPIAEGRHVTTLALSESGTGSHFYLADTELRREGDRYRVDGIKRFVTNGGEADSYVVSTIAADGSTEVGEFSCLVVDHDAPGLSWLDPWQGLGMRGNASRGMRLEAARIPTRNLLGEEGDHVWFVFEVVAPYFLTAMSAVYLGIARAALERTIQHVQGRRHSHTGETLAEQPVIQHELADMWVRVQKTAHLVYDAALRGDAGDADVLPAMFMSKADVAETAVAVTNQAMTLCGGIAYRENDHLSRLLRDARAAHVMSPTTHMLKSWTGRSLLGLPLL